MGRRDLNEIDLGREWGAFNNYVYLLVLKQR